MMKHLISIFGILLLFGCASKPKVFKDIDALYEMMQGNYSSERQSKEDSTYFNISLRMTPFWKEKGYFLYVEQALFEQQDKPYRVRVYQLTKGSNDEIVSEIFTLKNEKDWVGSWKMPQRLEQLQVTDLVHKTGCGVVLSKTRKKTYAGKTGEKTCPSELRGATYTSSRVVINPSMMVSWDQGYNDKGEQVWGATKGGYVFDKLK